MGVLFKLLRWYHHDVGFESPPMFFLVFVVGSFGVSAFFSWQEIKYVVWGREARAIITEASRDSSVIQYEWSYADDGLRRDRTDAGDDEEYVVGASVDIEYLPGVMASRLPGTPAHHKFALWVFFLSMFAIVTSIAVLWRRGNRELKEADERRSENGPQIGTPS